MTTNRDAPARAAKAGVHETANAHITAFAARRKQPKGAAGAMCDHELNARLARLLPRIASNRGAEVIATVAALRRIAAQMFDRPAAVAAAPAGAGAQPHSRSQRHA